MTIWILGAGGLTTLALVGWYIRAWAERREALFALPPGDWIELDGRRLHVRRASSPTPLEGPTIVFESGGAFSSAMWWPFQDRLAEFANSVAYDRAGLGWSDPAPLPRTIEQRAEELNTMLHAAKMPTPYVLVGLSYGGPLLRVFAARHQDVVGGLVFVDVAHESVFAAPGAQAYLRRSAAALRVIAVLVSLGLTRLLRLRGAGVPVTALPYSPEQSRVLQSRFPPAHSFRTGADEFESMLRISESMRGLDGPGAYGSIPISVISHGKPFPGPFAVLEEGHREGQSSLAAMSSNSELGMAIQSGHAVPLEEPDYVLAAIHRVWKAAREGRQLERGNEPPQRTTRPQTLA